jgi:hypothetical protein
MSADSRSVADADAVCRPVTEQFWIMTGNPQDIGTRLASAGIDRAAAVSKNTASNANLLTIFTTLLLIIVSSINN